jgi:SAM-dependent methyltransferase
MSTPSIYDRRYAGDYRARLSGYEVARWQALEHFLSGVVDLRGADSVLDYGAGSGLFAGLWEKSFPQAALHFCDPSAVAMAKFKERQPHLAARYRLLEGNRAPWDDATFDVIVSVEVLEHVADLSAYLRDVHRLLKPGGWFVWTTPCANAFSIEHLLAFVSGGIEPTAEGCRRWRWEDPTHLRRLRSCEAEDRLQDTGFSEVRLRLRAHLFSLLCSRPPLAWWRSLSEALMTLDYSLFRRLPNGASMIGAARKP